VCGRHLHHVLDVCAGVLLALAPLARALRPGVVGIVLVELVAVAWLRVTTLTRYAARADSPDAGGSVDTSGAPMPTGPMPTGPADAGPALSAIRGLGRMTAGARRRLPDAGVSLDSGARRMGAQAGRLQRAWRRATR
jgi:hypothetical protein